MKITAEQKNKINRCLMNWTNEDILSLVKDINSYNGDCENLVWYDINEFDEFCSGMEPWDIARACFYGDFNPTHHFWRYDSYGNFESQDYVTFDEYDIDEICEALENIDYKDLPKCIINIIHNTEE